MDALEKATSYLNRKPHTEKEVMDYLLRKGYEQEESAEAVRRLREYGYLDDFAYAKLYFEYGLEKGRGKERIVRELAGKGVARDLIDQAFYDLEDTPDEGEMARQIAAQILAEAGKDLGALSYEEKQKLQARIARRLASRGFSGSICWSTARDAVNQ